MIRTAALFTSLTAGFGMAAAFVAPSLVAAPGGEPIRVGASGAARLQHATFKSGECAKARRLANAGLAGDGSRIFVLTLRSGPNEPTIAVDELPSGRVAAAGTLLLIVDPTGKVLAASRSAGAGEAATPRLTADADCADTSGRETAAPI